METNNIRGALFIITAMVFFVCNDGFVKSLSGSLEWHQALTLRGLLATLFLLVLARVLDGPRSVRDVAGYFSDRHVALRAGFEILATSVWTITLMNMSLSGAVAVNQLSPVFLMLGGAVVFREHLGPHRLWAAVVSFLGVLLVVRPGTDSFSVFALMALLATALMAARDIVTRSLKPTLPSTYVAAASTTFVTIFGFAISVWSGWPPLNWQIFGSAAGAAVALSLAYLMLIRGARIGEVSFLAPFRYAGLVGGIVIAFIWFNERPDALSLAGAAIIVAAGLYILAREERARRRAGKAG